MGAYLTKQRASENEPKAVNVQATGANLTGAHIGDEHVMTLTQSADGNIITYNVSGNLVMDWAAEKNNTQAVSHLDPTPTPTEKRLTGIAGIKWATIPYEKLSNEQLLELLCQCKLQYGRTAGVSGTRRLWGAGSMHKPVLEFKNVDHLHDAFVQPSPNYYQRCSIFKNQSDKAFHLNASEVLTLDGYVPVVAPNAMLSHEQGSTDQHKDSVFMCTANVVCPYARVNLTGFVQTSADVCTALRTALNEASHKTYSQRYNALIKAAEAYGMLVPTSIDIGVRADFEYAGKVDKTISTATLRLAVQAALQSSPDAERLLRDSGCTIVGPMHAIPQATLNDLVTAAGDINAYNTVTVHAVSTIFDLLPQDTEENQKLRSEVFEVLDWYQSWSSVGVDDNWLDVKPLNFDGYQVWCEYGVLCVYCADCKTQAEAMEIFNKWWCATVVCHWDDDAKAPREIRSFHGFNGNALKTVRINVDKWYKLQLRHHRN